MVSTLASLGDFERRDELVIGLYGFASAISRRASFRHGFDFEDARQHVLAECLASWDYIRKATNPDATAVHIMKNGIRDFIVSWYGKGRTQERRGRPVEETDATCSGSRVDVMMMDVVHKAISDLDEKRRAVVGGYFFDDIDLRDMGFASATRKHVYISDFISDLQGKFGVEKVKRRVAERSEVFTLVGPSGIEETGTINDLSKRLCLDNGGVNKVCRGKKKTVKGWRLKK